MVTSKELSRGGDADRKLKLELNIFRFLFPKENQTNNKGPFSMHPNAVPLN